MTIYNLCLDFKKSNLHFMFSNIKYYFNKLVFYYAVYCFCTLYVKFPGKIAVYKNGYNIAWILHTRFSCSLIK